MRVLEKIYCGLIMIFCLCLFEGSSFAKEGIWTAQYFWWDGQEYVIWLRRDEPREAKSYYISHICRNGDDEVCGEEKIYQSVAVVSEVIIGRDFLEKGKDVVVFLNLQSNGYLSNFKLLTFNPSKQKLQYYCERTVAEDGHLLTEYDGILMWWRGLQPRLVLFDKKKKIKVRECLLGIIPSSVGGVFLELERNWLGSATCYIKKFSGTGKSLKMAKKEKMTQPIVLSVGQSIIFLRTGKSQDIEKFKIENEKVPVLEPFDPGLPTVLTAIESGVSWISIQLEGKSPQMLDIKIVVLKPGKKTGL